MLYQYLSSANFILYIYHSLYSRIKHIIFCHKTNYTTCIVNMSQSRFIRIRSCTSPGSVTDTDTEYRGISKYRYRYRSRYSKYRKIPNTEEKIPKKIGKSVFQFCKYNPSLSEFPPVLAANSARLNHFHDPSIQ